MKLLIAVDHAVGESGPHRNVVGTLNALSARDDIQVTLLTGRVDESEPYVRGGRVKIQLGFQPKSIAAGFANLKLLHRHVGAADVVYVPSGLKACLLAAPVCGWLRKPLVAGPNVTHLPFRRADSPGDFEVVRLCDLWIEASHKRGDYVRSHLSPALRERVAVVHHAIDLEKFSPAKRDSGIWREMGVPEDGIKVLYVGRDNIPLKGVRQLREAIDILRAGGKDQGARFIFVGRMSEDTAEWAGRRKNIHILGFQRGGTLSRIYASSDFSIVPSSWEGFGFTVLEALASGLPVIGSRAGAIPELIEDAGNGLLVDIVGPDALHTADAPERLAEAVAKLLADGDLRARLGQQARHSAQEKFSEARLGRDLMAIFQRVI